MVKTGFIQDYSSRGKETSVQNWAQFQLQQGQVGFIAKKQGGGVSGRKITKETWKRRLILGKGRPESLDITRTGEVRNLIKYEG